MFHNVPAPMKSEMVRLEAIDAQDRTDGTPRMQRLRQIPSETGRFLALLAATAPPGEYVEIGTSAGYSTLWLALACRAAGRRVTTFEILPEKARLAEETFSRAQVDDVVTLARGDARDLLQGLHDISFCFLDAEKEVYSTCYETVVPRMAPGGVFVADNAISHGTELQPFLDKVFADERVDALIVPIGKGELVCRRLG